MLTGSGDDLIN